MIQQHPPTVGDTITVTHRIAAAPGAVVAARPPLDSTVATLVAPPVVTREGDSVQIAYTVAVWASGHNQLVFPGAIVVDQRGHVDTLADVRMDVVVASVLPSGKSGTAVPPRNAQPWVTRADLSWLPFVVLIPLALLGIALMQWRWRRRGSAKASPPAASLASPLNDDRLEAWIAGGESRLALDHVEFRVRQRDDFADWRERAAAIRFAPGDDRVVAALVREAHARLRGAEPDSGPTIS